MGLLEPPQSPGTALPGMRSRGWAPGDPFPKTVGPPSSAPICLLSGAPLIRYKGNRRLWAGCVSPGGAAGTPRCRKEDVMFGDLGRMMRIAADVKRKMPQVQAKLEASEFDAEAGGGTVRAIVNGKGRLVDVEIDPELLGDPQLDAGMLEDLIRAAVSAAQKKAADAAARAMEELTGGLSLPGIEGLM